MKISNTNLSKQEIEKQEDLITQFKSKLTTLTNLKKTDEFKQISNELDEIKHWLPLVLEQIFNLDFWFKQVSSLNNNTTIDSIKSTLFHKDLDFQFQNSIEKWEAFIDNLIDVINKIESINSSIKSIKDLTSVFEQKLTDLGHPTKNVKNCPYKHN